jgi:dTDP-4-amino-4,6-dideoxygalactose transaminase
MKPTFIAASPNVQFDDLVLSLNTLVSFWGWYHKQPVAELENLVSDYHGGRSVTAFDSARTAFYFLLKAYGIGPGDEVLVPAFTCLVVVNPIIWLGAKPVYVDNGPDFNIDLEDLERKLTPKTKAVLVQHTFGRPVDVTEVRRITGNNIKIIEDTAHSLGGKFRGEQVGTMGDAAILTFGIEKVISCVRGGMALATDPMIAEKLKEYQAQAKNFSRRRVLVSLLNPVFWYLITPVYYVGIGKFTLGRIFAKLAHVFSLFGNMIEPVEYKAEKPNWFPAKLPGALAVLALHQFKKLDKYNDHRNVIADIYQRHLNIPAADAGRVYLRFPLLVDDRVAVMNKAKRKHVVLGDWYKNILYSPESNLHYFGYVKGSCPVAERQAASIINLPTGVNLSPETAEMIANLVKPHQHAA